jgi:SAM-dependent methyltransferase
LARCGHLLSVPLTQWKNTDLLNAMNHQVKKTIPLLDIGGEGRYESAINLNPRALKTLGPNRGDPIPNRIEGRAEAIPLPNNSVQFIVMERTPLRDAAVDELVRVLAPGGKIVLRHHVDSYVDSTCDPHDRALKRIDGVSRIKQIVLDGQPLQQLTVERIAKQHFSF